MLLVDIEAGSGIGGFEIGALAQGLHPRPDNDRVGLAIGHPAGTLVGGRHGCWEGRRVATGEREGWMVA